MLAERFEADFKTQFGSLNLEKEVIQPEAARVTMDNIYEKILFFLNHMCHSFVDYTRSESPMSGASNFGDNPSLASGPAPTNPISLQRFKMMQQQQQYRRWSEAAATTMEQHESNIIDANRRWSMPTNVSKTRLNVIPNTLAGLVYSPQQQQQAPQTPQIDPATSDGLNEAIQLLSFRPNVPSRPPSQQQQQQQSTSFQYVPPPSRNPSSQTSQAQTRQRQSRGELNEILILPRTSDQPMFLGFQQIAEARGENDEY